MTLRQRLVGSQRRVPIGKGGGSVYYVEVLGRLKFLSASLAINYVARLRRAVSDLDLYEQDGKR